MTELGVAGLILAVEFGLIAWLLLLRLEPGSSPSEEPGATSTASVAHQERPDAVPEPRPSSAAMAERGEAAAATPLDAAPEGQAQGHEADSEALCFELAD